MAPLLVGFVLLSWVSGLPVLLFCFLVGFSSKGELARKPTTQSQIRGAYQEKNQRSFELATDDECALCLFYGALSTYVATHKARAVPFSTVLIVNLGSSHQRAGVPTTTASWASAGSLQAAPQHHQYRICFALFSWV